MKWIGLTGGIASGKTTVSQILQEKGYPVIDADEIARSLVQVGKPGLSGVVSRFGSEILNSDGSLNRKKLGQLVFGNPQELAALENLLHPLVKAETLRQRKSFETQGKTVAFYDVPLLFEKKMEKEFDGIILVFASEDILKTRMKARDSLSDLEISQRLGSQISISEKAKKATWILKNEASFENLRAEVDRVLKAIQSGNE